MPYKRKDTGRWYTDIRERVGGKPTGRRIRLLMPYVKTKPEAKEEEHRIIVEMREGKTTRGITLADFLRDEYLLWADQNKAAPQNDHTRVKALIDFFGQDKLLTELSFFDIERYKRERAVSVTIRGGTRAAGTINNELSVLSRAMNMAMNGGLITKNPTAGVQPLEQASWRTRSLSPDEEQRLLKHAIKPAYLRPLIRFAILTGMREAEMFDLEWEHVRLDRALLYVVAPKWSEDPRKTEGLPVVDEACELLSTLPQDSPYVFPSTVGTRLFQTCMGRAFNRTCEDAGIDDFRFHDLRHTFGSRMAESGIKLHRLQRLMGHQDPKMTTRYIHVDEEELREALRSASPFLQGKGHATDTGKIRKVV